jgi:hypothetical protein
VATQKTLPSGESAEAFIAAVADDRRREANLVMYLVAGVEERYAELLERLGPHKLGKGCLYLKGLDRTVRAHRATG